MVLLNGRDSDCCGGNQNGSIKSISNIYIHVVITVCAYTCTVYIYYIIYIYIYCIYCIYAPDSPESDAF